MGKSEYTPIQGGKADEVSEMGERDLSINCKKPENYLESSPSEMPNPLDDFKRAFWRNDMDSPEPSPLKITPHPIFSPRKAQVSPKFKLKATVIKKRKATKSEKRIPEKIQLTNRYINEQIQMPISSHKATLNSIDFKRKM
jgi:hypothetical protein